MLKTPRIDRLSAVVDFDIEVNEVAGYPPISNAVITSASKFAGLATIKGAVHSKADSFVRVELFASFQEPLDMVPDAPTAQGQTYLGYVEVRTNSQGSATFSDTVVGTPGQLITATATEDGTTSNFSNAVAEELSIVLLPPIHIFNPIRV